VRVQLHRLQRLDWSRSFLHWVEGHLCEANRGRYRIGRLWLVNRRLWGGDLADEGQCAAWSPSAVCGTGS
jgi:hypothetical protein